LESRTGHRVCDLPEPWEGTDSRASLVWDCLSKRPQFSRLRYSLHANCPISSCCWSEYLADFFDGVGQQDRVGGDPRYFLAGLERQHVSFGGRRRRPRPRRPHRSTARGDRARGNRRQRLERPLADPRDCPPGDSQWWNSGRAQEMGPLALRRQ
jgi:hypothetical protein